MERRFVLFLVLSFGILLGYSWLMRQVQPPKPAPQEIAAKEGDRAGGKAAEKGKPQPKPPVKKPAAEAAEKAKKPAPAFKANPRPEAPEQWVTLGSADPKDPYRMLVTLTNKGAAVARIELSSSSYRDIDDRSGYLGHLVMDPRDGGKGCRIQVVGPGTPAAEVGLKPGDIIKAVGGETVTGQASLEAALEKTKPNKKVKIKILRDGKESTVEPTLRRIPLEVIKPENDDPLSMLLTLDSLDDVKLTTQWARDAAIYGLYGEMKLGEQEIADLDHADIKLSDKEGEIRLPDETAKEEKWVPLPDKFRKKLLAWLGQRGDKAGPLFSRLPVGTAKGRLTAQEIRRIISGARVEEEGEHLPGSFIELEGVNLRTANWTVVPTGDKNVAQFRYALPEKGIEVTKTYRLAQVPQESLKDGNFPAYHLEFSIDIRNIGSEPHTVAYRLDGPNGLPTEGAWYSSRVTRSGGSGLRDFVVSFGGQTPGMVGAMTIAADKEPPMRPDTPPDGMLTFVGVDAQYFSAVLLPQRENSTAPWFDNLIPIRVGKVDPNRTNLTNTSCRLISVAGDLKPGETMTHKFQLFAGPKKPAVVEPYGLGELVYYGWFSVVAVPLTYILHFFYSLVGNYGLAIILLTVFVRGCMFPLSLKQAAGAQKMQLLQPEIKKIQEKHKGNAEARTKAQQELFRKHNYNPLAGCLPIFIQMPVFIGLYRSLMVAIELRDAPLFSNSIRWCSNLAAPDMLYDWSGFIKWPWFNEGVGVFALGPYFNLLPLLTIVLFLVQQKMFMPPAADEQAAMQQKIMKYMMVFMGVMFFKVASGLCIYFIASSLWGLAERRFLPKTTPVPTGNTETRADVKAREREIAERERREKEKKGKK